MVVSLEQALEIIKVAGLVAGGLWTAWTFKKLQKNRAAEAEINQKLAETQKSRLEKQEMEAQRRR